MRILIRFALTLFVLVPAGLAIAAAHSAPSGWDYPASCCRDQDCMQIPDDGVRALQEGWGVNATGEVIPYSMAKPSLDGSFHRCSPHFADAREPDLTICLFAPPQVN